MLALVFSRFSRRVARVSLLLIVILQTFLLVSTVSPETMRWSGNYSDKLTERWPSSWLELSIPEHLKHEPYLYLFLQAENSSNLYVAPFLDQQSSFVLLSLIAKGVPDWHQVLHTEWSRLLTHWNGRIKFVDTVDFDNGFYAPERMRRTWQESTNLALSDLNLAVDVNACERMTSAGGSVQFVRNKVTGNFALTYVPRRTIAVCTVALKTSAGTSEQVRDRDLERMTEAFAHVVAWCPRLFQGMYRPLQKTHLGWLGVYDSTNVSLLLESGRFILRRFRVDQDIMLGTVEDWARTGAVGTTLQCSDIPLGVAQIRRASIFHLGEPLE